MRSLLPAVSFLCLTALAGPAFAGAPPAPLVVNSAFADGDILTILGASFGTATPYVTLGGIPLVVLSSNRKEIQAQLPVGIPPGSYRLLVARNPHRVPFYLFNVTIGTAGPQGEPGPQGIPGPQGPPGPDVTAEVKHLQGQVEELSARLLALETKLARVSVSGDDIYITGANLHVTSGSGSTDGPVNGLGNLIIGYNEPRDSGDNRSGSHNLVVGSRNNYLSYGGFVGGLQSGVTAPYSTAFFGQAFDFRATGTWGLRASTFNVDTDLSTNLRAGANLTLNASTNLSLRSSGIADLQAAGTLTIKGATVNIN